MVSVIEWFCCTLKATMHQETLLPETVAGNKVAQCMIPMFLCCVFLETVADKQASALLTDNMLPRLQKGQEIHDVIYERWGPHFQQDESNANCFDTHACGDRATKQSCDS